MKTFDAILEAMEEVLGLDKEELHEMADANLIEEDLIDSLSVVTVLRAVERRVGFPIDLSKMKPADFVTLNRMSAAIESQK